jgi:small subunit ribosomal protein S17
MTQEQAVNRKARVGTVVSDRNDQTVVVAVERASRHRIYRKVIRQTKKYHVHDPNNDATRGDVVRIEECRPISKLKRWRLVEILTERAVADVAPESIGQEVVDEVQRSASRAAEETGETATEAPAAVVETPAAEVAAPAAEAEAPVAEAEAPAEEPVAAVEPAAEAPVEDAAPAADDEPKVE